MNTCPVCSTKNHHLNVTCSACGGYVQGRVDNLDLFSTIWRLIENPRRMFLSISLARYKNYSTIVPAIAGIGLVFMLFWFIKAGDYTPSALNLLAGATVLGPAVGVVTLLVLAGGVFLFLTLARVTVRFRNLYAVLAYAFVPVMLSVFFILPLVIFSFGRYFFSMNPPPWLIKPVSYYVFLGLGAVIVGWTLTLLYTGMRVLLDCRWKTAAGIVSGIAAFLFGAAFLVRSILGAGG